MRTVNNIRLTTPVEASKLSFKLSHHNSVMTVGSCFTENMGGRLQRLRFRVMVNPFGIMYNPFSIATVITRCLDDMPLDDSFLVYHDGLWHSWLHHGSFSRPDKEECLEVCNTAVHEAHRFLCGCDTLIVTFGSAWYFNLLENGVTVANCHKVPAARFEKRLATVDDVVSCWNPLIDKLREEGIRTLFTVSPVRHSAYGAHGNQLGKAVLLLALEQLGVDYFPAYEIMMDELRDYRFYADDLLHPSAMAEEIVWRRLQESLMPEETVELCAKIEQLNALEGHRLLHPDAGSANLMQEKMCSLQREVERLLGSDRF